MADTPESIAADFARSMAGVKKELTRAVRAVAKEGGAVAREEHHLTAAQSAGPDRMFSRFKKAGKLDVKLRYNDDGASVIPRGPWKIAEEGAAPHGGHPGTRAKQGRKAWTRAEAETIAVLDDRIPKTVTEAVDRGFHA